MFIFNLAIIIIITLVLMAVTIYLCILIIKALKKHIKSEPIRKEKEKCVKSLGEVLKMHRTECKMTQEFVSEAIGVSRQAVSKWESGKSDPSTANLIALAKLFNVPTEDLLKEVQ